MAVSSGEDSFLKKKQKQKLSLLINKNQLFIH